MYRKAIVLEKIDGKVKFRCIFCGNKSRRTKETFKETPFCWGCTKVASENGAKKDEEIYEFMEERYQNAKKIFKTKNMELLSSRKEFKLGTKVEGKCDCGENHFVFMYDMERDTYIPCRKKRTKVGQGAMNLERVKKIFEEKKCEYIGPFVNTKTDTKYKCHCGKEAFVKIFRIKDTWNGCRTCSYKLRGEKAKKK